MFRSPFVDPVGGWTFIVAEFASTIWSVAETISRHSRLSPEALAYSHRSGTPLWASITDDLINLVVVTVIGFGIVRGRAWALWVQGLISLRIAFYEIVRPRNGPLGTHSIALFGFSLLVFVYAGLRILGVVGDGPRPLFRRVASAS